MPQVQGFDYYGYTRAGLQNVQVNERGDTDVDTITEILDRKTTVLTDGQREIKVIYICTATYAADQAAIYQKITKRFGARIHCKMLISDDTRRGNDIPPEYVVANLAQFFDSSNLTDEICTNGALVLIARKTLAASATVKPGIGTQCARVVDGMTYMAVGITDQITGVGSSIEDHMQKSRLFGWFPSGHSSTYWVSASYMQDMHHGVNDTHRRIIDQYDCEHRLDSITTVHSSMLKVPRICAGECPYRRSGFNYVIVKSSQRPSYGTEVTADAVAEEDAVRELIEDGPIWICVDECYHIYMRARILVHAQIEQFESWSPSVTHEMVLRDMVKQGKDKHKTTRFYDVFGQVIKKRLKILQGDMYYSTWQAQLYKELDDTTRSAGKQIAERDESMGKKVLASERLLADWIQRKLSGDDGTEFEIKTRPTRQKAVARSKVRARAVARSRARAVPRVRTATILGQVVPVNA